MTNEEIAVTLTEHGQYIKSNTHRIDELEEFQKEMRDLVRSVDKLAPSLRTRRTNRNGRENRLIPSRPRKMTHLSFGCGQSLRQLLQVLSATPSQCLSNEVHMKKVKKKDHFKEFSKLILFLFAVNYFVGGAKAYTNISLTENS